MVKNHISISVILEDDVICHEDFSKIFAKEYFPAIPNNADILYLGWQRAGLPRGTDIYIDAPPSKSEGYVIKRHPVTTHAYMLTLKGAMKLLACIAQDNDSYVYDTIDMIMAKCALDGKIDAYAINGRHHPPSSDIRTKIRRGKDVGICYQDKTYTNDTNIDVGCQENDCIAFRGTQCSASAYTRDENGLYTAPEFCKFEKYKLEFIHIPKTGGSAITKTAANFGISWASCRYPRLNHAFEMLNCPTTLQRTVLPVQIGFTKLYEPWHVPGNFLAPNPYSSVQTFTVVRNPFTRVLSAYYCKWNGGHKLYLSDDIAASPRKHMNAWITHKLSTWPGDNRDSHLTPQFLFVYDVNASEYDPSKQLSKETIDNKEQYIKIVEHVLKYEGLQEEFKSLMKNLGYQGSFDLGKNTVNAGSYQGTARLMVRDIEHSTVKLIQDFYREDFDLFGYSLEPPTEMH